MYGKILKQQFTSTPVLILFHPTAATVKLRLIHDRINNMLLLTVQIRSVCTLNFATLILFLFHYDVKPGKIIPHARHILRSILYA